MSRRRRRRHHRHYTVRRHVRRVRRDENVYYTPAHLFRVPSPPLYKLYVTKPVESPTRKRRREEWTPPPVTRPGVVRGAAYTRGSTPRDHGMQTPAQRNNRRKTQLRCLKAKAQRKLSLKAFAASAGRAGKLSNWRKRVSRKRLPLLTRSC